MASVQSDTSREESQRYQIDTVYTQWIIDLYTGEKRALFSSESGLTGILALGKSYALVSYYDKERAILTNDEFIAEYGEGLSYGRYYQRARYYELRLYDPDFNDYTVLTSTEQGYFPSVSVSGREAVYVEGGEVHWVSLDTGESRLLLTMEGIINYHFADGKVFLFNTEGNVLDAHAPLTIWYADVTDCELVRMENGGDTKVSQFGIYYEGQSFFIDTMNRYLSKEDYYAERYENAKLL